MEGESSLKELVRIIKTRDNIARAAHYLLNWGLINLVFWGCFVLHDGRKILSLGHRGWKDLVFIFGGLAIALFMLACRLVSARVDRFAPLVSAAAFLVTAVWDISFAFLAGRTFPASYLPVSKFWIWLSLVLGCLQGVWSLSLCVNFLRAKGWEIPSRADLEKRMSSFLSVPDDPEQGFFTFDTPLSARHYFSYKARILPDRVIAIRKDSKKFMILKKDSTFNWRLLDERAVRAVDESKRFGIMAVDSSGRLVDIYVDEQAYRALLKWAEAIGEAPP